MNEAMWIFLGTIFGACVSIVTTWLSNYGSIRLEKEKSKTDQERQKKVFQLENFLKLQDAIEKMMRCVNKVFIELTINSAGIPYAERMTSDETSEAFRMALVEVKILAERIAKDDVREQVVELLDNVFKAGLCTSASDNKKAICLCNVKAANVIEKIGVALRSYL